jgi:hypothetical protein
MSTTLARKIRRIGLVRTARTAIVITKDEQGNEVEVTHTAYHTRRRYMPDEEREELTAAVIAEWRTKRKKRR